MFEAINRATGSLVDDYEEAEIATDAVSRVREVVEVYARRGAGGPSCLRFFAALMGACDVAQRERRPMCSVL